MSAYDMVNRVITKKLMEGVVPWKKLWKSKQGLPALSLNSGIPYNGINQVLLTCLAMEYTDSPYFLTYKQAVARGGYIKKGEKGFHVVFFKSIEDLDNKEEVDEEDKKCKFVLRYYTVFNLSQCENVKLTKKEESYLKTAIIELKDNHPIKKADDIVSKYRKLPVIQHGQNYNPSYCPAKDSIFMPPIKQFEFSEEYYASLFHEIIHSTGHTSRLNRKLTDTSIRIKVLEELIAEIGSAYLSYDSGIVDKVIDNNVSYINYWIDKININKRLFTTATSKAEKAYKYIISNSNSSINTNPKSA